MPVKMSTLEAEIGSETRDLRDLMGPKGGHPEPKIPKERQN